MDRRAGRGNDKDNMTFFDPPSVCNNMPKNHVPEWYFETIRNCIIPRKGFGDGTKEQEQKKQDAKNVTITVKFIIYCFIFCLFIVM